MGVTVAEIIRTPGLDLRLVAGSEGLSHSVRWVHVSELEDPTPWLKGGELLLTTGMGVGKSPAAKRAYLDRLTGADLAGLGFGTGFSFRAVPRALVVAADRASFPIFEVPYPVPFIAITEAVFTRLVAEQYDLLSRSLEAEHTLTRAVLEGLGPPGIIRALTKAVRGWGVLLDIHGALIACSPGAAREHVSVLWSEIQSPRADHLRFSLSMVDMGHHISIQPVASQGRIEAFLAVGKRDHLTQFDRIVSSHALSLLAIELTKARAVSEAERRLKGDLLDQILRSALPAAEARQALERIGFDLSKPLGVAVFFGQQPAEELALVCEEVLARQASAFMASPREDVVLTVLQPEGPGYLAGLRAAVAGRTDGPVLAGAGGLVPFEELLRGVREARYALQLSRREGRLQAEFADLGTYQLLLSLQDPEALQTFADSVLGPLDEYDGSHGGELIVSLRAFLDHNARWESAAKELFVHRHTLRYRMRKVEELTGRDLGSARDRMEFFLALRARDLLASAEPDGHSMAPSRRDR